MSRVVVIYRGIEQSDRWFPGDHKIRGPLRRLIRGPDKIGGVDLVYLNLISGLQKIGIDFATNIPLSEIRPDDWVGVIGRGKESLSGYTASNPIVAGVAVAEHPATWPTLFEDYPIARYVVHCDWVKTMYDRWYPADRVVTWAVGIDTDLWSPKSNKQNSVDFLIYDKIRWDPDRVRRALLEPIIGELDRQGLTYQIIRYGHYLPSDFSRALDTSQAMIFLCEHESQGLAYQQAMSAGVPVLAWDPQQWLDPWRYKYGETFVAATSTPFFDHRCGDRFNNALDFPEALAGFRSKAASGLFSPRSYVLENLSLSKCAEEYVEVLRSANSTTCATTQKRHQ